MLVVSAHPCNKTICVMEIVEEKFQEGVGREGIEPSWVAPGDFKSHIDAKCLYRPIHGAAALQRTGDITRRIVACSSQALVRA